MNIYEIVGAVTGLLCVLLIIYRNIWNWPIGIISVIAYAVLFFQIKLYADMSLQIFYVVTGFIGWWMWAYGGEKGTELKVRAMSWKARTCTVAAFIPCYWGIAWFLQHYTNASIPFWDSFASTLSVFAQILLMKKLFENWILWIAVDVLSIGIYIYKGVYLTVGLYSVFLVLAIMGFIAWKKLLKKNFERAAKPA